jgi:transcriptional regulator with XRE-family HTH domain
MEPDRFAALISGLESNGITQPQISRATGLSRTTVWRLGAGLGRAPSYETIKRLETLAARTVPVTKRA